MNDDTATTTSSDEPDPSHDEVPELEVDETVPPRPEEEVADAARDAG